MSKNNFNKNKSNEKGKGYKDSTFRKNDRNGARGTKRGGKSSANDRYDEASANYTQSRNYTNDPAWYTNRGNTGLAGGYSFFYPVGLKENVFDSAVSVSVEHDPLPAKNQGYAQLPGICRITLQHTIGTTTTNFGSADPGNRAINVALNKLYSEIRHANSGARNYEKSDLGIYMLAVADAYAFYGMMCRAYACMRKYSALNRYLAKPMVDAMGFDFDTLSINLPAFKTYINQFAMRLNVLFIPSKWPYFNRRYMLYSHVFGDEPSEKCQFYVFVPRYFFKFHRDETEGKGELTAALFDFSNGLWGLDNIVLFGNGLISDIILDDDFNLMSGDIAKYTSDLFKLPYMAEDYILDITYDDLVLSQIENATVEGLLTIPSSGVMVSQSYDSNHNDYLVFSPVVNRTNLGDWFTSYYYASKMKRIFNIHEPLYDEGRMLDATRLTNMPTHVAYNDGSLSVTKQYDYCSTEMVASLETLTGVDGTWRMTRDSFIYGYSRLETEYTTMALRQFNRSPMMPIIDAGTIVDNKLEFYGYNNNVDNYLLLDVSDFKRLHEAAVLSLFDVN